MNAAIEVVLAISRVQIERAPPAPSGRQEGARVLQNALPPEHLVQLHSGERGAVVSTCMPLGAPTLSGTSWRAKRRGNQRHSRAHPR